MTKMNIPKEALNVACGGGDDIACGGGLECGGGSPCAIDLPICLLHMNVIQ